MTENTFPAKVQGQTKHLIGSEMLHMVENILAAWVGKTGLAGQDVAVTAKATEAKLVIEVTRKEKKNNA